MMFNDLKLILERLESIDESLKKITLHQEEGNGDLSNFTGEVDDELYAEAEKTVKSQGFASAALLQRRLRIGYARAARLLDILEDKGVIGPADGAKPRSILDK